MTYAALRHKSFALISSAREVVHSTKELKMAKTYEYIEVTTFVVTTGVLAATFAVMSALV